MVLPHYLQAATKNASEDMLFLRELFPVSLRHYPKGFSLKVLHVTEQLS